MKKRYVWFQIMAVGLLLSFGSGVVTSAFLPQQASEVQAKKKIGKKKAKKIALKDAGLKKSEVSYLNVSLDYEDDYRTDIYEVEFQKDRTEYSYDIDAYTGKILDKDMDYDD